MTLLRSTLNTIGLLLLAVAIFYSQHFWPRALPLLPVLNAPVVSAEPDYSITEFHAMDLDESGRLRYELTATQLLHYPQPERADLLMPNMIFYRNNNQNNDAVPAQPWQLTADTGQITGNGQRLDLSGGVQVAHLTAANLIENGADRMTMETEQLSVFGTEEIASSDAPVLLSSNRAQLRGTGMKIDMKKGRMHLLSQVRGNYAPQ